MSSVWAGTVAALALACSLTAPASAQQFAAARDAAQEQIAAGRWLQALEILLADGSGPDTDAERADAAGQLDRIWSGLRGQGDDRAALRAAEAALAMRQRIHGPADHTDVADGLNHVGVCLYALGRAGDALPPLTAALAMRERLHGPDDHPEVARGHYNVAACLESLGRASEALPRFEAALAMRQRLSSGPDDRDVADGLNRVASCLQRIGRSADALPKLEAALAMRLRMHGEHGHDDVAQSLNNPAACLETLGRADEALPHFEAALAMRRRIHGDRDHPDVALGLGNVAYGLRAVGRLAEALPQFEAALAMGQRLHGEADHPDVAHSLHNLAVCLGDLGHADEALPRFEAALAMRRRLNGDRDHPDLAGSLSGLASCLRDVGRAEAALPLFEAALAMRQRLHGDRDHPKIALRLQSVAGCLMSLGRPADALPRFEAAAAMLQRLYGGRDHPSVAVGQGELGRCLAALGRADEALVRFEATLAMQQRIYGERDHTGVATSLNNVAFCLKMLGRVDEALPRYEQALAMRQRLYGERDHPDTAFSLANLAACLKSLDRVPEALERHEAALAMRQRLFGGRDHPDTATSLSNVVGCLFVLGHPEQALARAEAALAMRQRLYGGLDHRDVANSLDAVAGCLHALGRSDEALPCCVLACDMIERLRDQGRVAPELRQSLFDELKSIGAFEHLQALAGPFDAAQAFAAAERSRGRELLDLLEQQGVDPLDVALHKAHAAGDAATAGRLQALAEELPKTRADGDRLLFELTRLGAGGARIGEADAAQRRAELVAQARESAERLRQLRDERARLLGDAQPVGRVRTLEEIQAVLEPGELLLEFTVAEQASLLYVVADAGPVQAIPLPLAHATVQRTLPIVLGQASHAQLTRGKNPDAATPADSAAAGRALFGCLLPAAVWQRVQGARRVFVAAHRGLHRLPFELLVTGSKDDRPLRWLDSGPPVTYVPSGSVLHWLRTRRVESAEPPTLGLLAVGDPRARAPAPALPAQGVLVTDVAPGSAGARAGLRQRDVIVGYEGQPLADLAALGRLRAATEAAIQAGSRPATPIPVDVWRDGSTFRIEVRPGPLGVRLGSGPPAEALTASMERAMSPERLVQQSDLERIAALPPLSGARAEATAIAAAFRARQSRVELLLGDQAAERAVFELAPQARYLHFACHGLAAEYAGQSLSMLVLSQPQVLSPEDDGMLRLRDLVNAWPRRLGSCDLAVLSACRTNVGPTYRDEAPQALPTGFLLAGAPSVISSLWAVDDASTRELMTDFYDRLLAGETDRLRAFWLAKQALRAKYPDPFHWAPFLYLGLPE